MGGVEKYFEEGYFVKKNSRKGGRNKKEWVGKNFWDGQDRICERGQKKIKGE